MNRGYTHIIGIDPDSKASGVAALDLATRELTLSTQPFFSLTDMLKEVRVKGRNTLVVIENAYSTSHNWHYNAKDTRGTIAKKGYSVGLCAQTYHLLKQYLQMNGIDFIEQLPLTKIWRGGGGKISHEELVGHCKRNRVTLHPSSEKRSNQEERDAALLALLHIDTRIPQICKHQTTSEI
nr:MAG TPA: HOLLIDAY JUNCTION RESOLVASE [Caudoviricetes sp.]